MKITAFRRRRGRQLAVPVLLLCATAALAGDAPLTSRPVGFVRIAVDGNKQALVCMPFNAFDPSINAVIGTNQLTGSSDAETADRVLTFDPVLPGYTTAFKTQGKWYDLVTLELSDMELTPGTAVWIDNRQGVTQQVFLAGELVMSESNSVALLPSLNMVGYPFSTSKDLADTCLSDLLDGTNVLLDADVREVVSGPLGIGQGYWLRRDADTSQIWTELRPYADVFPSGDEAPCISSIHVLDNGESVELSIVTTGDATATFEVFYKDVGPDDEVDVATGWRIAATGIRGSAHTWVDVGSEDRASVSDVHARYYLLARSDVDVNGNGIPDAREVFVEGLAWPVAGRSGTSDQALIANDRTSNTTDYSSEIEGGIAGTNNAACATRPTVPARVALGKIVFVDRMSGNDSLSGRSMVVVDNDGPKRTIAAGLRAVKRGGTVVINQGSYGEDLNVAGRDLDVRIRGSVDLTGQSDRKAERQGGSVVPPVVGPQSTITNVPVIEMAEERE